MTLRRPTAATARVRTLNFAVALAMALIAFTIAGCGGGGGGGSSAPTPIPATLTGTVDISTGTHAVGYVVRFVNNTARTATTSTLGAFSIAFDAAQLSGSQPIAIYDTTGTLIDRETITVNAAGGTQSLGTIDVGPPAPPS